MQRIVPIAVASMLCGCIIQGERPADSSPPPAAPATAATATTPAVATAEPTATPAATTASDGTASPPAGARPRLKAPAAP